MGYLIGKVIDLNGKKFMPGAVISVQGTYINMITDVNGEFKNWEPPVGEHISMTSYLAFDKQAKTDVPTRNPTENNINLPFHLTIGTIEMKRSCEYRLLADKHGETFIAFRCSVVDPATS